MVGLLNVVNKALVNIEGEGGGPEGGVTSEEIWDKLGRMFDLEKLDILVSLFLQSGGELRVLGGSRSWREESAKVSSARR